MVSISNEQKKSRAWEPWSIKQFFLKHTSTQTKEKKSFRFDIIALQLVNGLHLVTGWVLLFNQNFERNTSGSNWNETYHQLVFVHYHFQKCLLLSDASIPSNYYINFLVPSSTNTMSLLRIDLNRQNCDYHTLRHSIPGGPLAAVVAPQLHLQRSPVRFVRCVKILLLPFFVYCSLFSLTFPSNVQSLMLPAFD